MKPETSKEWELALSSFTKAEELFRDKKFQEAEGHAVLAVVFAARAMIALSKEPNMPDLSEIAKSAILDYCERTEEHYIPKETIEWSRNILERLSDELPPDTFSPFRY